MLEYVMENMLMIFLVLSMIVYAFDSKKTSYKIRVKLKIFLIVSCIGILVFAVFLTIVNKNICKLGTEGVVTKIERNKDNIKGRMYYIESDFMVDGKDYRAKGYTYENIYEKGKKIVVHYNSGNPNFNYAGDVSKEEVVIHDTKFGLSVFYIILLIAHLYYGHVRYKSRKHFGMEV